MKSGSGSGSVIRERLGSEIQLTLPLPLVLVTFSLMALSKPAHLVSGAAVRHGTPATPPALARIQKQPSAFIAAALTDPREVG
jgi:hypothetical protein